jgi:hypothetical protein
MFTYQSTEPKALLCVVQLKSDLHDRRSQSSDTLEFRVLLLLLLLLTTLHNNIIAAHTIQPHLATELKALLNRSSHNFFGTLFISGGIILLLRRSKEEERRQQRVVAFDGIMNLRQISAARHGRKRKIG